MIDIKTKINSFFIFNSNFGPKEGDELKRILFFYPDQITVDARKIQVGLCEAVVKFMTTFSSEPCEALQTQTKRYIFFQPEKHFWMVLIVRIPYATKALTGGEKQDIVEPSIMYDLLESAYKMFKMFIGHFKDIPPEEIYSKCEHFFTPYMASRSISCDITNVIPGINYLPLENDSFFKVICFIDLLEINYPDFKCVSFIYNEQLIWNGLSSNDMLTLYQYLVQTLLPKQVEKELQGGAVTTAQRHGRFICPPDGIRSAEDLQKLVTVHLMREEDTETKEYYLIIYRTLSATISFTVDVNTSINIDTFRSLDAFIGPQLSTIASSISEQCALLAIQNAQLANTDHKFLYFNRLNYAFKSYTFRSLDAFIGPQLSTIASSISEQCTLLAIQNAQLATTDHKFLYFNRLNYAFKSSALTNALTPSTAIKPEVLSIIAGIHSDRKSLGNYGEIIIKTPDEYWITGKSSNEREFYVVIQVKNANLKEIADEVRRICEAQMKGIFFYPM